MEQYNSFNSTMVASHFKKRVSSKNKTSRNKLILNKLFFCGTCLLLSLLSCCLIGQTTTNEYAKLEVLDYPNSIAKLLKKFNGRVVYIDLMASWCKPCIEELKEAKKLESYFEENNIVNLFITIDMQQNVENAYQMVQNESLSGYFVSIPPINEFNPVSFRQDILDLFFKNENGTMSISLPRYAIVNKKGKFVEKNATRPSNSVVLKKQLEKYLQ